ncbi:MAG TPA: peptide ligase PGM1-related protein [Ferruginibacter sp.]|nr:peptide ligase PGM1-related protein [Ferruginibacter sp.]
MQDAFDQLQERFAQRYNDIFSNDLAEKTVVVIPSISVDQEILQAIKGAVYYEERMLCMLLLLRMPRTRVIYVTSMPIDTRIVDYYLQLLPGITGYHARERLTMLSCYDASARSLTEKILERPRLIKRIRDHISNLEMTHMACFNVTDNEKALAIALNTPIFGCDPKLLELGTKTGSRMLFKRAGIRLPKGFEGIKDEAELIGALTRLKKEDPALRKAVVKMNDGFSGDGNALFSYYELDANDAELEKHISGKINDYLHPVAPGMSARQFISMFNNMSGVVEEFIEGERKESPSVQCRINPDGNANILSTHDQLLGGESNQVFLGSSFPASAEYGVAIAEMGKTVTDELQREGVLGRFAIDFISVKNQEGWQHYALEINLRKGGTTHPFIMLQFLTGGNFDWQRGEFILPDGQTRCYFASDNVIDSQYKGLTPQDLIDIAVYNQIQYDPAKQTGVMFHMIGALSQFGKLGMVCIGKTQEEARAFYQRTIQVLDKETA